MICRRRPRRLRPQRRRQPAHQEQRQPGPRRHARPRTHLRDRSQDERAAGPGRGLEAGPARAGARRGGGGRRPACRRLQRRTRHQHRQRGGRLQHRRAGRPAVGRPPPARRVLQRGAPSSPPPRGRPTRARGGYAGWQATAGVSRRVGRLWMGAFVRHDSVAGAAFAGSPLVTARSHTALGVAMSWVFAVSDARVADSR